MRLWILVCAAALVLTACDAGHRENPGVDNKWQGPEVDIQVPGHSTTVKTTWAAPTKDADGVEVPGEKDRVHLFFRLRPLAEAGEVTVRYAIDSNAFATIDDATVGVTYPEALTPGTHRVSAYVVKADGAPRFGARATSVSTFIVEAFDEASGQTLGTGGTNEYGYTDAEGFWQPLDPNMPAIVVEAADGAYHVLAHRCALDGERYRVRYSGEGIEDGIIAGDDAESGRFGATIKASGTITFWLEEVIKHTDGDHWKQVKGSDATWSNANQ